VYQVDINKGTCTYIKCGPGSSVGIATNYGLDGPGIESWRWRDFPPVQTGPGAHPASCTMGIESFPGVKCGRGVLLTTHLLLAPRSWKGRAIPLPPLCHNLACNGVTLPLALHIYNLQTVLYVICIGQFYSRIFRQHINLKIEKEINYGYIVRAEIVSLGNKHFE